MSETSNIEEIYDTSNLSVDNSDVNEDIEEIENLIYNLTETDIIRLYKNYSYKMDINDYNDNSPSNSKPEIITEEYLNSSEPISEVKYNIFMRFWNACKLKEDDYRGIIKHKDKTFYLRRLVAQDFNIINNNDERELCFNEKKYSFIPIDEDSSKNCLFHIGEDVLNIEFANKLIKNLKINGSTIEGMTESEFEKKFNVEIPKKVTKNVSQKSVENKRILSEDNKVLSDKNPLTDPPKNVQYKTNKRFNSNDSYKEEFSGSSIYVNHANKNPNNFTRYFFVSNYSKEIDGVYTMHNDIKLNIGKVEFPDLLEEIKEYNCDNDLKGHILYKNFDSQEIMENEPIILEIKSGFSIYDLMNQIKQNIKIINNTSKKSVKIILPKYIIGILCDYKFESSKNENKKLNAKYFNNIKKTELNHILEVIEKSNINVVVCFIKNEINGYNLLKEDYNISEKLKYRIDLKFMYKQIFKKEIDDNLLKEFKNKIEYQSVRYEKTFNLNCNFEQYSKLSSLAEDKGNIIEKIVTLKDDYDKQKKQYLILQENYEKERKQKDEEHKKQILILKKNEDEQKERILRLEEQIVTMQENYEKERKKNEEQKEQILTMQAKFENLEMKLLEFEKQQNQKKDIHQENNPKENNMGDKNLSEKITQNQSEQEKNLQTKNKQEQESLLQSDNS